MPLTIAITRIALFRGLIGLLATAVASLTGIAMAQSPAAPAPTSALAFRTLSDDETGLKPIVETWKADELKRQGGKFGSHGWWPWGLTAFDYDRDGCLDLIVQQHGVPGCIVLRGLFKETGAVRFENVTDALGLGNAALTGAFRPRVWDIDGDGWLDVVGLSSERNACFFNQEGKRFVAMNFSPGTLYYFDTQKELADLDGDGFLDFFTASEKFLFNTETRKFTRSAFVPPRLAEPPEPIRDLIAEKMKIRFFHVQLDEADLNVDGRPDLVAGGFASYSRDAFSRYLIADEAGKLVDATEQSGLPGDGTPILARDLTGDGAPDVLVSGGTKAGLYLNDGQGRFTLKTGDLATSLSRQGPYLHTVVAVDLSNDGRTDLVLCNPRGGQTEIYENTGDGGFRRVVQASSWEEPVVVGDLNADGLPDVAIAGPRDTISVFLNETPQAGRSWVRVLPRSDRPNPFAVGALIEVFRAGELGRAGSRPVWSERAHADGTPIHVGLGPAKSCDLRATFPGEKPRVVEQVGVASGETWNVQPDGTIAAAGRR